MRRRPRGAVNRWLFRVLDRIRTNLWVMPLAMTAVALAFARLVVRIDGRVDWDASPFEPYLYDGVASNAQTVLSSLAAALITVAGTALSITVVTLSFASTQLGPRLLRKFMGDRKTQVFLGSFLAAFSYQVVVLSSLRGDAAPDGAPRLATTCGLLFAGLAFASLIYFIHHVASSISVEVVVERVHADLERSVARLFGGRSEREAAADRELACAVPLASAATGYVQAIDFERLVTVAARRDGRIRLSIRPGHFVMPGAVLLEADRDLEDCAADVRAAFVLGPTRTGAQDVEHSIRQLVEIALRALSPGVNDPFTAIACVDHLGAALGRLARLEMPSRQIVERDGVPRLEIPGVTFAGAVDAAFNQVRQHGRDHPAVMLRVLEALANVASRLRSAEVSDAEARRGLLASHVAMIHEASLESCAQERDARELDRRLADARAMLDPGPDRSPQTSSSLAE